LKEVKVAYEKLKSELTERPKISSTKNPTLSESELLKLQQELFAKSRRAVLGQQHTEATHSLTSTTVTNNDETAVTTNTSNSSSNTISNNNNNNNNNKKDEVK
jgi:hypothetical protein